MFDQEIFPVVLRRYPGKLRQFILWRVTAVKLSGSNAVGTSVIMENVESYFIVQYSETITTTVVVEVVNILLCFLHRLELTKYRSILLEIENIFFLPVVCVCVVIPFILDVRFVDVPSGSHTGGRSHRTSPPSFCGACLNFCREKDSAVPFPRRP